MNDMYYYHYKLQSWFKIEYKNQAPTARYGHTMELFDNTLYIFGGYVFDNEKYVYSNELYLFSLGILLSLSLSICFSARFKTNRNWNLAKSSFRIYTK